jgi:FlaA1/EpsC-like NDP-sugar epimerase
VYTGLRPGEKLHEELFGAGERDARPLHPLISHVEVPPLDPARVRFLDAYASRETLVAELAKLCAEVEPERCDVGSGQEVVRSGRH